MQEIRRLLASILFCCYAGADPTSSSTEDTCAAMPILQTLLIPYMNMYDDYYYGDNQNNYMGRRALNAILLSSFSEPFSNFFWELIDSFINHDYDVDDTANASESIQKLYNDTVYIFINLAYSWLHGSNESNLDAIEKYLGLDPKSVDLINMSITELNSLHRKKYITIDKLLRFFYFACDIKNIGKNVSPLTYLQNVKSMLHAYVSSYSSNQFYNEVIKKDRALLMNELRSSIDSINKKTNASFGVSISTMKMKILTSSTKHELVKLIQYRPAIPDDEESLPLNSYVQSYAHETDPVKVNAYHLCILSVIITHVFGYVYNYFELLSALKDYKIYEKDKIIIEKFSTFMDGYMSIFIERYFEFYGKISQDLVDAMFSIMFFFNPNVQHNVNADDYIEEEKSFLNAAKIQQISILEYYENYNQDVQTQKTFLKKLSKLFDDANDLLKTTFLDDVFIKNELLYKCTKLPHGFESFNKLELLELMEENCDNATKILAIFSNEFGVHGNSHNDNEAPQSSTEVVENV